MNTQATLQGQTRASYLSRDQRLEILVLYRTGFTYKQIVTQLRVTYSQVKNTVQSGRASPKLWTGRPPKLSPNQIDQLEEFICSFREARQCSYLELSVHFSSWAAGENAIRSAVKGRGYSRCLPRRSAKVSAVIRESHDGTESMGKATPSTARTRVVASTLERRNLD
ncbi:hypothetical protein K3495_g10466 [Podosphaera aphanis]|nr:hypothetical protein K3495_g10466 [Podosphaera aphanis]